MPSHVYSPVNVWLWISWPMLTWRSWERERMELPLRDSVNLQWSHLTNSIRTRSTSFLPTQWNLTGTLHREKTRMRREMLHRQWLVMYWGTPLIRTPISEDTFCCLKYHVYCNILSGHLTNQDAFICVCIMEERNSYMYFSLRIHYPLALPFAGQADPAQLKDTILRLAAELEKHKRQVYTCTVPSLCVWVSFFYLGKETHSSS